MRFRNVIFGFILMTGVALAQAPSPTAKLPSAELDLPWSVSAQYMAPTNDWGSNWNFHGVQFDAVRTLSKHWSLDAEFDFARDGGYHDATDFGYRFGPRFNIISGHRITPFAEFLVGGAHLHAVNTRYAGPGTFTGTSSWNGFSFLTGGGVDIRLTRRFGLRGQAGVASVPYGIHKTDRDYWGQYSGGGYFRF